MAEVLIKLYEYGPLAEGQLLAEIAPFSDEQHEEVELLTDAFPSILGIRSANEGQSATIVIEKPGSDKNPYVARGMEKGQAEKYPWDIKLFSLDGSRVFFVLSAELSTVTLAAPYRAELTCGNQLTKLIIRFADTYNEFHLPKDQIIDPPEVSDELPVIETSTTKNYDWTLKKQHGSFDLLGQLQKDLQIDQKDCGPIEIIDGGDQGKVSVFGTQLRYERTGPGATAGQDKISYKVKCQHNTVQGQINLTLAPKKASPISPLIWIILLALIALAAGAYFAWPYVKAYINRPKPVAETTRNIDWLIKNGRGTLDLQQKLTLQGASCQLPTIETKPDNGKAQITPDSALTYKRNSGAEQLTSDTMKYKVKCADKIISGRINITLVPPKPSAKPTAKPKPQNITNNDIVWLVPKNSATLDLRNELGLTDNNCKPVAIITKPTLGTVSVGGGDNLTFNRASNAPAAGNDSLGYKIDCGQKIYKGQIKIKLIGPKASSKNITWTIPGKQAELDLHQKIGLDGNNCKPVKFIQKPFLGVVIADRNDKLTYKRRPTAPASGNDELQYKITCDGKVFSGKISIKLVGPQSMTRDFSWTVPKKTAVLDIKKQAQITDASCGPGRITAPPFLGDMDAMTYTRRPNATRSSTKDFMAYKIKCGNKIYSGQIKIKLIPITNLPPDGPVCSTTIKAEVGAGVRLSISSIDSSLENDEWTWVKFPDDGKVSGTAIGFQLILVLNVDETVRISYVIERHDGSEKRKGVFCLTPRN